VESPVKDLLLPGVKFMTCPIGASLGILGRKWTLLILRNIGFLKTKRFNKILQATPGLTPRVLSMRLRELEDAKFIRRVNGSKSESNVHWVLTEKGKDVLPILLKFVEFGAKWHADTVFEDKKSRTLQQIFLKKELLHIFKIEQSHY
jgi:DNA-binding HxlR family transcriptional regulator